MNNRSRYRFMPLWPMPVRVMPRPPNICTALSAIWTPTLLKTPTTYQSKNIYKTKIIIIIIIIMIITIIIIISQTYKTWKQETTKNNKQLSKPDVQKMTCEWQRICTRQWNRRVRLPGPFSATLPFDTSSFPSNDVRPVI